MPFTLDDRRAQRPGWVHAAACNGHRSHVSDGDGQTDCQRRPSFRVGPLRIGDCVDNEKQQERNDRFHEDALDLVDPRAEICHAQPLVRRLGRDQQLQAQWKFEMQI